MMHFHMLIRFHFYTYSSSRFIIMVSDSILIAYLNCSIKAITVIDL